MSNDTIYRQDAVDAINELHDKPNAWLDLAVEALEKLQSAEPERKNGKWNTEEVAEILFNAFGDDCACNFNGIDEWLPERCKYTQIADECPEPKEKHGCWMQFLLQGGADMRGDSE